MTATPDVAGVGAGLAEWMAQQGARAESALAAVLALPPAGSGMPGAPATLAEAMRYAVLGGGKRVRPLLVYAAGEVSGAEPAVLDGCACAVELIHAYSLVHDDLPCMDNDDLRRGKLTVHRRYGEALAMLVGDALQALAFEALVRPLRGPSPASALPVAELVATLAQAAGATGMAGGQALDLQAVGSRLDRPGLETMHRMKTGAMLAASVRLGMLAGGPMADRTREAVDTFSDAVGLAFQVVDDILDVTADSATLGKTAGKDEAQDKPTYVSILGLEESRALAEQLAARARSAAELLDGRGVRLRQLADFIVKRVN